MFNLSQKELRKLVNQGKTAVWQFNTLYQVTFCANLGKGEYYLREVKWRKRKMGVTRKGRYVAMTPKEASQYI